MPTDPPSSAFLVAEKQVDYVGTTPYAWAYRFLGQPHVGFPFLFTPCHGPVFSVQAAVHLISDQVLGDAISVAFPYSSTALF